MTLNKRSIDRCPRTTNILIYLALLASACGPPGVEIGTRGSRSTIDLNYDWQPFARDSVWNLKLSPTRGEAPIPTAALDSGDMAPSDAAYGIKVYFAKSTDPLWSIGYDNTNSWLDTYPDPPMQLRAPSIIQPPTGTDGTVIVVDVQKRYAYEMWQFVNTGGTTAHASDIEVIDLNSSGIHRNVGITGSGLPGSGGLLKSYETRSPDPIRHKMWVAAHPAMLYANAVWPASAYDVGANGAHAFLNYGDVVALKRSLDLDHNECNLSPFIKRIARALQDYGGIIQDQGGDALGFVAEVDSIRDYIDVDYETVLWEQFACLKKYMVKVTNPWTGAVPGGLGF